jgi:hypothetical protein
MREYRGIGIWCCSKKISGWRAHRRPLVRGLPLRNKAGTGKPGLIWGLKTQIRPQCRVTTPLWAPGADSGQQTKPRNRRQKFGPKNRCSARPWSRRAVILANERHLLVRFFRPLSYCLTRFAATFFAVVAQLVLKHALAVVTPHAPAVRNLGLASGCYCHVPVGLL